MIVTIPCYPSVAAFVNDQNRIKKLRGNNMKSQKEMNHFIGWKFGIPVKVVAKNQADQRIASGEARLVDEDANYFSIIRRNGEVRVRNKQNFYYELIPHKYNYPGDTNKSRYPICESPEYTAYCNCLNEMVHLEALTTKTYKFVPIPVATLNIDGKTIELSAETTAELKKKLGI